MLDQYTKVILIKQEKEISFHSFAKAIERGDTKFIDKALETAPLQVDFRDLMSGTSILHIAARYPHGSLKKFLRYSHIRALIDTTDNRGATPLIVAVRHENIGAVRLLLQNGAKTWTHLHESGQTALHIASTLKDESILKEILKYNDTSYFLDLFDKSGNTALLTGATFDTKCSEFLVKAGANYLAKNKITERNILHLAILYQRKEFVEFLVTACPDISFITALDANGDSALKLALELKDIESAMILLKSIGGEKLVDEFPDSLMLATKIGDEELFEMIMNHSSIEKASSYCSEKGETVLAMAATDGRIEIVKKLLRNGLKPSIKKDSCRKSLVDIIENSNDFRITKILLDSMREELGEASDMDQKALDDVILRRSSLGNFIVFQQSVSFDSTEDSSESPLFTTIRSGNYGALLFQLLSTTCSQRPWLTFNSPLPSEKDLLRLFLKKEIYASDVYIFTGTLPDNPRLNFCPSQTHLFRNNQENRNVFHACAIGGSLDVVIFVYEYCMLFHPEECQKLDVSDATGSTPLLLSVLNRSEDVAAYLIQKGANLIKANSAGETPIRAIVKHIPEHKTLLIDVMTQCIVTERDAVKKGPKTHPNFSLHLYLLHPKGVKCVTDVGSEICKLNYFKYRDIICHPLLDYFVWYLWDEIGQLMKMRFYIAAASTVCLSSYVTLKYSQIPYPELHTVSVVLWWLSLWFAKMRLIFHLPIFFVRTRFIRRLMLLSTVLVPLLEILYLTQFNKEDRTSMEVGATAILASWLSLLFHGVATPNNGVQIMTFCVIFQEMCVAIPTFFTVTFAFTLYFFTLFNGYLIFNNPMHAFLFTAYQIPEGSIDIVPSMYEEQDTAAHTFANATAADYSTVLNGSVNGTLLMKMELRTMMMEGMTVLLYLLIATALTNMLTALAIQAGEEHLVANQAKTIARKMNRIREWEKFVNSKFHAILSDCKALWVVGVPPNIKEVFVIPQVVHPMKTPEGYDVFRMKKFLTDNEDIISNKRVPFLLTLLKQELLRNNES